MDRPLARCDKCGHSRAAHLDGIRCALCGCLPDRTGYVQEAFAFRSSLPRRAAQRPSKRKAM